MSNPFQQRKDKLFSLRSLFMPENTKKTKPKDPPDKSLFVKCPVCDVAITKAELAHNLYVCPKCGYHHSISAYYRLKLILDNGTFRELNRRMVSADPLQFPGYVDKLSYQQDKTGLSDAVITATGKVKGYKAVFAVMDSRFFMGSMGTAVGEKITRAIEYAHKSHLPLVIFSASGGARMQEGIFSLMQMAKTSAALQRFHQSGGLFISYLTHPTTGGVTASFASLGDITLAEPGALIGFAGPRVIEQTIKQKLPDGFQRSEYLEEHGFIDQIIPRNKMRDTLALLLQLHEKRRLWF